MTGNKGLPLGQRGTCCRPNCDNLFIAVQGRRKHCEPCHLSLRNAAVTPANTPTQTKRGSDALSPPSQQPDPKALKSQSSLLYKLDITALLELPPEDIRFELEKAAEEEKEIVLMLHQLHKDLEDSQSDFKAETKRRMELELDCDLLKKGIAEKELLLIKSRQLRPRKESTAESLAPGPTPTPSFANAVKSGKSDKAVLVVKAAANADQSTVNRKYFDELLGFKNGGPPVQRFRRSDDQYVIQFPSIEQRDKAKQLIEEKADAKFGGTFVPAKVFPLLAKFNDISSTQFPGQSDDLETKKRKEAAVISALAEENPEFKDQFASCQVLSRFPDSGSFMIRLSLKSAIARDALLYGCSLKLEGGNHRVDKVDPNREVRGCSNCQSYSHSTRRCNSSPKCGLCAKNHRTFDCMDGTASLKCANCNQAHKSGDFSCVSHRAAVAAYIARNRI